MKELRSRDANVTHLIDLQRDGNKTSYPLKCPLVIPGRVLGKQTAFNNFENHTFFLSLDCKPFTNLFNSVSQNEIYSFICYKVLLALTENFCFF